MTVQANRPVGFRVVAGVLLAVVAAVTCRTLGALIFAAGLVERLILSLRDLLPTNR